MDSDVEVCSQFMGSDFLGKVSRSVEDGCSRSEDESDAFIKESPQYTQPSIAGVEAGINTLKLYLSFGNAENVYEHISALHDMFSAAHVRRSFPCTITGDHRLLS